MGPMAWGAGGVIAGLPTKVPRVATAGACVGGNANAGCAIATRNPAFCAVAKAGLMINPRATTKHLRAFPRIMIHLSSESILQQCLLIAVVDLDVLPTKMKTDLSIAELLALVEIVDEHVDRNFPGVDPPHLLREIQQKLDTIVVRHRKEIDGAIKAAKKKAKMGS